MHLSVFLVAVAYLVPSIQALPPGGDACAKAASSGPTKPPQGVNRVQAAKSDCSSFLSKLVSLCPATATTTSTSTRTAKGITRTSTKSITITATAIRTLLVTVDQSLFLTQQQTQLTTLLLPETTTSLTTETTTTTSTIFETLRLTTTFSTAVITSTAVVTSTLPRLQRRETSVSVLPDRPHPTTTAGPSSNGTLYARQGSNEQCRPVTWGMSDIPQYAAPCRDLKAYSTACQQMGVSGKTTTLQPSATYVTKTNIQTVTPTILVNATKTFSQTITSIMTRPTTQFHTTNKTITTTQTLTTTSTSITTSTLTSTIFANTTLTSTAFVSVVATSTALVTSTALATPTPPAACPSSFRLHVANTPVGTYVRSFGESEKMGFTNDTSVAAILSLDSQNRLYEPSTSFYPNTEDRGLYYVYQETAATVDGNGYLYLQCKVEGGKFGCSKKGQDGGRFWWCPVIAPPDALVFGSEAGRVEAGGADCVGLNVQQECVV